MRTYTSWRSMADLYSIFSNGMMSYDCWKQRFIKERYKEQYIDTGFIAHTNNPEYEKLKHDPIMESLRDRTIKVDVPYLMEWQNGLVATASDDICFGFRSMGTVPVCVADRDAD